MSESVEFDVRDRQTFRFHATPLRKAAVWALDFVAGWLVQGRVLGLENVPAQGALILASNHVSNLDVFVMQLAMPRPIFFMGKAELFKYEPVATVLRDFGAFPVYRGESDGWALRHARKVLDAGQTLGMFPEGHRSKGNGLGPAKTGTARLAIEARCPILPMAITGTDRVFRSIPLRAQIDVTFLPSIHPQPNESPEALTDRLMTTLAAHLPESMRGVYR
jgi:1-acyl-sn-glycerol-3-phosphate acyltransferase